MITPALLHASYALAHVPDVVRYGSKPTRELARDAALCEQLSAALRTWEAALAYPPNQVFIGNLSPERLAARARPWSAEPLAEARPVGPFGRMVDQITFYGLLKLADDFDLVVLDEDIAASARAAVQALQPNRLMQRVDRIVGVPAEQLERLASSEHGLPLFHAGRRVGFMRSAHDQDASLGADILLENLAGKATAALALSEALVHGPIAPEQVDYLLNTGEEAVGDRYQRGGGSLSKAAGEVVGCINATGSDIKAFCSAPVHGLIIAASLVQAGLFRHVVVIGGGSLAKLGMKFLGHLKSGVPIMEDVLASMAFVVGPANGQDPVFRLDSVGRHTIQASSAPPMLYQALVLDPLTRVGLKMTDIDRYAVELHNPEITLPAGSGDVPLTNYRTLAALAVKRHEIERSAIDDFVSQRGMPGFAPTQGHIPAGVPYLGHARRALRAAELQRIMVVAKGSLFLGRMTQLSDGMSFILERDPSAGDHPVQTPT
ncbi:MAG: glycine reductase [Anaerolineales bacterium]|nr:glycine reductase [Anaerolineales bacterium]